MNLEAKLTVEVRKDHYRAFRKHLHHGLTARVIRAFVYTIAVMVKHDKLSEIQDWLTGRSELVLPAVPTTTKLDEEPLWPSMRPKVESQP